MIDQSEETSSITPQGIWLRICRHRLLLMVTVFAGWLVVTTAALLIPAKYRSETVILIEQQRVPEHYVEPNVAVDLQQRLQSMSEQILSRTRLLGIIDKFHLYGENRQADSDRLLQSMRSDISVDLVKGYRPDQISAFKVSYSASSPVVAQQVTAELTSLFIEENLRNREQLSEDTTTFLESELADARKNLDQQEQRLREFKSRYMGQLPEQTTTNLQILTGLQSRLQAATDALNQAEQQRLYLQSLLDGYRALHPQTTPATTTGSLPVNYTLDQKLAALKSQLAELSTKYTSKHPDVVRLQEEITATEKLIDQTADHSKSANPPADAQLPAVAGAADRQTLSAISQLESQLKANEFDIKNRKTDVSKIETEIDGYQERLNLTPAREQELAAITRDHEQSRVNYESLLAKRNQSVMATNLEKRQQGEQFTMIDPPSLPQKPYFPNRLNFSLGGLAFGVSLAFAIVLVMEFANPCLYGEEELNAVITAPILITIPPLPTPAERRKKFRSHALEFVSASVMLVVFSAVTLVIYRKG